MVVNLNNINHHGSSAWCQFQSLSSTHCTCNYNWHACWLWSPIYVTKKEKQKGAKIPSISTIPSFLQRCPFPSLTITAGKAAGTNHSEAPQTKKMISTVTTINQRGATNNPIKTWQSPPDADFSFCWLRMDLPMSPLNTTQYSHKDILSTFHSFALAAFQIDLIFSFLTIF